MLNDWRKPEKGEERDFFVHRMIPEYRGVYYELSIKEIVSELRAIFDYWTLTSYIDFDMEVTAKRHALFGKR